MRETISKPRRLSFLTSTAVCVCEVTQTCLHLQPFASGALVKLVVVFVMEGVFWKKCCLSLQAEWRWFLLALGAQAMNPSVAFSI